MDEKPADAFRTKADSSLVARRQGRRRRRGRRGRVRRQHGSDARGGARPAAARPRRAPPGDRRSHSGPQGPLGPDRRRRERRLPRRAPASSSRRWVRSSQRRCSASRARACASSRSARSRRRGTSSRSRRTRCSRPPISTSAATAEGRDVLEGAADVLVTDGFTGNVTLKAVEGTIRTLLDSLREEITASTAGTLGGLLIRPAARRLRKRLDPDTYGGAYLLGLRGLVVIAHGNSSATAIANAIRLAARGVDHDVVGRLAARLSQAQRAEIV